MQLVDQESFVCEDANIACSSNSITRCLQSQDYWFDFKGIYKLKKQNTVPGTAVLDKMHYPKSLGTLRFYFIYLFFEENLILQTEI